MAVLPLVVALLYIFLPGHPGLPFSGLPVGLLEAAAVAALVTAVAWSRPAAAGLPVAWTPIVTLCFAAAVKVTLASAWFPSGWLATYYANASLAPPDEQSTDPPPAAVLRFARFGTRIDPVIDFRGSEFPVYFQNDSRFAHGDRREWTDPFSVEWLGLFEGDRMQMTLVLEARGTAQVLIDGVQVVAVDSPVADGRRREEVNIARGQHIIKVRYSKPANAEAFVRLSRVDLGVSQVLDDLGVLPFQPAPWRTVVKGLLLDAGSIAHGAALLSIACWLGPMLRRRARDVAAMWHRGRWGAIDACTGAALMALWVVQGTFVAWPHVNRVWTLPAGSEAFAVESQARDILIRGALTSDRAVAAGGQQFLGDPAYSYFVAAAHRLTGESLAGVIQLQFIVLGIASVIVFQLAKALAGPGTAILATVWLLALDQLDFVRSSTATLAGENLFFVTSAMTVLGVTRYMQRGLTRDLVLAALIGGISALTRPSIMFFLPCAAVLIAVATARRVSMRRALGAAMAFVAIWILTIAPAAYRNNGLVGAAVLASAASVAPAGSGPESPRPTSPLARLGYRLGIIQWTNGSSKPHPELALTAVIYLLALFVVPAARAFEALPLHLFVVTHLAALMLAMPPGESYRRVLPVYLFMPVFASAVVAHLLPWLAVVRRMRPGAGSARAN